MAQTIKNPPDNAGDTIGAGSITGSGRLPGEGNGNLLQYSCLGNPIDRGAWWAPVQRVAESQTWLRLNQPKTHKYYNRTRALKSTFYSTRNIPGLCPCPRKYGMLGFVCLFK